MSELVASNRDANRSESEGSGKGKTGAHAAWRAMLVSLLTVVIVSMNGCGGSSSKYVGKWQMGTVGGDEFELLSDGHATFTTTHKGRSSVGGTWSVLDDGRVRIEVDAGGSKLITQGTSQGDQLELSGELGGKYKRAP